MNAEYTVMSVLLMMCGVAISSSNRAPRPAAVTGSGNAFGGLNRRALRTPRSVSIRAGTNKNTSNNTMKGTLRGMLCRNSDWVFCVWDGR